MARLDAIFEPRKVVVVGSSRIQERVGMASPELFKNVVHNLKKFYQGETCVLDVETTGATNWRRCLNLLNSQS